MKRSDATAALSWANNTRATGDTRITSTEFHVLCVIAGGCRTRAEIALAVGCSESTVPRAVRKLVKIGALKRQENAGKANDYAVQVRQIDTGVTSDTGITTSRATESTRITEVRESDDTGAVADTGCLVDNTSAHIEHAGARGEAKLLSLELELNSETVESSSNSSSVRRLNGTAKGMLAHELLRNLIEIVDSPSLSARSYGLSKTAPVLRAVIDDGADFDLDVVPTVQSLCDRQNGKPISSMRFFEAAIRDHASQRLALEERARNPITIEEANAHVQRPGPSDADYGRRKRNRHSDLLMQGILDDPADGDGRVGAHAGK